MGSVGIQRERSPPNARCCPSGNSVDGVEPFLVRSPKIIYHCLPEVIAVREWLFGDSCHSRVERLDASAKSSVATLSFDLVAEFILEPAIYLLRLRPAAA